MFGERFLLNHFFIVLGSICFEEEKATFSKEPKKESISRANFIMVSNSHFITRAPPSTSFPFIIHLLDDFIFLAQLGRPIPFKVLDTFPGLKIRLRSKIAIIKPVISMYCFLMFVGSL